MRKVSRSALVPYTCQQMQALVDDVERYPEFLPWCSAATLHWRRGNQLEASIEMHRAGLRRSFRTRNTVHGTAIDMVLVDGPFSHLAGRWQFHSLADAGCKVALDVEFAMPGRIMDTLLGGFFEAICNSLVDAFVRRAAQIYADRTGTAGNVAGDVAGNATDHAADNAAGGGDA